MKNYSVYLFIIVTFAAILFFVSNHNFRGYLRSEVNLAKELKSPLDSIDQYKLATQAPFKYRLLFPSIVKATYNSVYEETNVMGFFYTYKLWSLIFYITAACAMFWLLLTCGFSANLSLIGTMIFLLLPPMLLAYTLPVHTREDTLAYTLFFTALVFLLKDKKVLFVIMAVLGVLCRETLLLLPLLYFFFSKDKNWFRRFAIAGVPGVVWLSIRLLSGHDEYDVWEGLRWNLNNPEQVVGFLFVTFNVCWIPFLFQTFTNKGSGESNQPISFFYRTSIFTLAIILITTFVGGIYNEIRLLYLFSPWMIIIALHFLQQYGESLRAGIRSRGYLMYAFIAFAGCATLLYFFLKYQDKLITPGKFAVPYHLWITFSVCYIFLVALFLPLTFRVLSYKKLAK